MAVVASLNFLFGSRTPEAGNGPRNAAQRTALAIIGRRARLYFARLLDDVLSSTVPLKAWAAFQSRGSARPLELIAKFVDCPDRAGTCDPCSLVAERWKRLIGSARGMSPDPTPGWEQFSGFYAGPRREYIELVVRQLRCGKTELRDRVSGGGTIFPVGTHGAERQREVWHDARVSQACARPPAPRWLASPSAFGASSRPGSNSASRSATASASLTSCCFPPSFAVSWGARPCPGRSFSVRACRLQRLTATPC